MKQLAIIDDDPEILKLLEQYLTKNGFEVRAFTDGESFLKSDESDFSLIVLDRASGYRWTGGLQKGTPKIKYSYHYVDCRE